jgi:hypothetical protein
MTASEDRVPFASANAHILRHGSGLDPNHFETVVGKKSLTMALMPLRIVRHGHAAAIE